MKAKSPAARTIDEYIGRFPPEVQKLLAAVRETIRQAAPDARELISYQIPAYDLQGILVYFAAFQRHIGLYPRASGIEKFKKELSAYKGAKGSVQFPLDQPLPLALIRRIVKFRVQENLARATAFKAKPAKSAKSQKRT